MRRLFSVGLLGLLGALSWSTNVRGTEVCPLFPYMYYETYASYYSAICEDGVAVDWVSWDGPLGLPYSNCGDPTCSPLFALNKGASPRYRVQKTLDESGVPVLPDIGLKPVAKNGAKLLAPAILVKFKKTPDAAAYTWAIVNTVVVPERLKDDGAIKAHPGAVFMVGRQVAPPADAVADFTLDKAEQVVKTGDHTYQLKASGLECQVLVAKEAK